AMTRCHERVIGARSANGRAPYGSLEELLTMRHSRRTLLAAVAVAASLGFSPAFAADPIKIGVSGPFTGGSSSMGVSMRDGVKLAIDEINKAGGVLGRPLAAVERDDEARNELGV